MEIFCQVTPNGLVPLYDSDYQLKTKLKNGMVVKCKLSNPRNYRFHKKFFALVRLTMQNLPDHLAYQWKIHTEADMLKRFKRDLGYFTCSINELGEREIEYKSISFASMEQHEFERFFNECLSVVINVYLQGIDKVDLMEELENFM